VGQHVVFGVVEAQGADHPRGLARIPVVTGELHAVDGERRRVVGDEHAVGTPPGQRRGSTGIAVGQDQPDRIVRVACRERRALVGLDDVVGWCAHVGEVGGTSGRGVADSGEGKKSGHGCDSVGER
jgi:hypothetical protein